jgi:hypothetical protein
LRCLYHIFKPIFWYVKTIAHTDLCIAFNPVHKLLYSSLHFEQFGEERTYESVNKNPSIAMRLRFDGIEERAKKTPGLHKLFIGNEIKMNRISDLFKWSLNDFTYFFIERSDVLKKAATKQLDYLKSIYPQFPIDELLSHVKTLSHTSHCAVRSEKRYEVFSEGKELTVPQTLQAKYEDPSGSARSIKVLTISRGGLCIEDSVSLTVGTCLKLNLLIKDQIIRTQGEVVWNRKEKKGFVHGLKFTFIEPESREQFNTFIMDWAAEQIAQELDFSGLKPIPAFPEMERRSFARLKIPLSVEFGFNQDHMLVRTQIVDLSEGGLCLISNFELKKGQDLSLKLQLTEKREVSLMGTVRYCLKKGNENQTMYFNGIQFSQNEKNALEEIAVFLAQKRSELATIELNLDQIIKQTIPLP